MEVVDELKKFGETHARAQQIAPERYREICAGIRDDGAGPDSWVGRWSALGDEFAAAGADLDACRHYNLARLPYADSPAKVEAARKCVAAFSRWAEAGGQIERVTVETPEGTVRCWATGLSEVRPQPVLLAMGGIVSIKEQWAPLLTKMPRLGMAAVVAEMPGVGENTQRYSPDSWKMLSAILDAVADRAVVDRTYAMALSFSGHLAMRCAVADPRIQGIATVGAPVRDTFTDAAWKRQLPTITRNTLSHLAGAEPGGLDALLTGFALGDEELSALEIPVNYVASKRDEIIPGSDVRLLTRLVRGARVIEFDDEHASPNHSAEVQAWVVRSILRMRGGNALPRAAMGVAGAVLRARRAALGLFA